jgi:hypothetical protein
MKAEKAGDRFRWGRNAPQHSILPGRFKYFFGTADERLNVAKEKGSAMPLPFESSDFQARSITDPDI